MAIQVGLSAATVTTNGLQPYTIISTTNNDANYPASNVQLYQYPFRTCRSTATGTWHIVIDAGAAMAIAAFFIHKTNFGTILIEGADDSAFTVNVVTILNNVSVPQDARVNGRRKAWLAPGAPPSKRYYRFTPSGATDGGAAYWEIGVIALIPTITTSDDQPGAPWRRTRQVAATRVPYASGGEDVADDGPHYLELTFQSQVFRKGGTNTLSLFETIQNLGMAGYFVIYENRGNVEQAYLVRRVNPIQIDESFASFAAQLDLREAV